MSLRSSTPRKRRKRSSLPSGGVSSPNSPASHEVTMDWTHEVVKDTRVVHKATNTTGIVHKRFGTATEGGVQVWVPDRGNERENWYWGMITVRQPRSIKRYPRPLRWPRTEPSLHCHCRGGPLKVEGKNEVRCQNKRCGKLVGSESFPKRFRRASQLLREASVKTLEGKPRESEVQKGMDRSKHRAAPRPSGGSRKKGKIRKSGVVVRSASGGKKKRRTKPAPKPAREEKSVDKEQTNRGVPGDPSIPEGDQEVPSSVPVSPGTEEVPPAQEKTQEEGGLGQSQENQEDKSEGEK